VLCGGRGEGGGCRSARVAAGLKTLVLTSAETRDTFGEVFRNNAEVMREKGKCRVGRIAWCCGGSDGLGAG